MFVISLASFWIPSAQADVSCSRLLRRFFNDSPRQSLGSHHTSFTTSINA
jgi:hypothetical protein